MGLGPGWIFGRGAVSAMRSFSRRGISVCWLVGLKLYVPSMGTVIRLCLWDSQRMYPIFLSVLMATLKTVKDHAPNATLHV